MTMTARAYVITFSLIKGCNRLRVYAEIGNPMAGHAGFLVQSTARLARNSAITML